VKLSLYATTERHCERLSFLPNQIPAAEVITSLSSGHEEADTRIISHAVDASTSCSSVIIDSSDADVAVMALGHIHNIHCNQLILLTGRKDRPLIDLTYIAKNLGPSMTQAILGVHAFSGCDAVSSFVGKGKNTHYQLIKNDQQCRGYDGFGG